MSKNAIYTMFDENFLETGATMIYSFLRHNKWFEGDIFVLCDDGENCYFSEEKRKRLKKLYDKIVFYEVKSEDYKPIFDNFPLVKSKNFRASFYKLEMFKKDDYDMKLYIDADTCFNGNVSELFNIKNEKIMSYMCLDSACGKNCLDNTLRIKKETDYGNMGFLLLRGTLIKDNYFGDIFEYCTKVKPENFANKITFKGLYGEQDCLNEVLKNVVLLPAMVYDASISFVSEENIKNVKIFHYYGLGRKPWQIDENLPTTFFDAWYRNYYYTNKILNKD